LRPLDRVLVRYTDDPALWHMRVVLGVLGTEETTAGPAYKVKVVSPDRDIFEMILRPPRLVDAKFYEKSKLPAGVNSKKVCTDAHSPMGRFGVIELRDLADNFQEEQRQAALRRMRAAEDVVPSRRLRGKTKPEDIQVVPRLPDGVIDSDEERGAATPRVQEEAWMVVIGDDKYIAGSIVSLPLLSKTTSFGRFRMAIVDTTRAWLPCIFVQVPSGDNDMKEAIRDELKEALKGFIELPSRYQVNSKEGPPPGAPRWATQGKARTTS
jgi:hypothetical protein